VLLASIVISPNAKTPATVVAGAEACPRKSLSSGDGLIHHKPGQTSADTTSPPQ
jgi:hypothetical protein